MHTKSYRYPLLNDEQWLRQKYLVEGLGTRVIAKLAGARTANSARQALIRHNIPVRTVSDGLTYNRQDDFFIINEDVINGTLLGDANLTIWNNNSPDSYPYYRKHNKYYDHLVFVGEQLFEKDCRSRISEDGRICNGRMCPAFSLRSLSNKKLLPFYRKWYPQSSNYVKVVPQDLVLNATSLLHWFLDDGCSYHRRRDSKVHQVIITLCSESFSAEDQNRLRDQLMSIWGLKSSLRKERRKNAKRGTGFRIQIPQSQAEHFFDIIGPCPVESLAYKWKRA